MVKINIAIDGPGGSGKTTIGRLLAKRLNYQFFDSGLLYRHFAFFYQQNNVLGEEKQKLLSRWKKWLVEDKRRVVEKLEEERLQLSSSPISDLASQLSPLLELRKIILDFQRELTQEKCWIVVGRDITSEVLPEAEVKIFLTASLEERAKRRNNQYGEKLSSKEAKNQLQERDERDKSRKISPLKKTADSWELDTTFLSPGESVEKILKHLNEKLKII
jgi:CMP/dCMP kinase